MKSKSAVVAFLDDLLNHNLVGPPGFEPGSREPKSQSLDHASRRPPHCFTLVLHKDCSISKTVAPQWVLLL
jgi:hypothetical protein